MYPQFNIQYSLIRQKYNPYIYPKYCNSPKYASNSYIYEVINKTACEILEKCDGVHNIDDIAQCMSKKYKHDYHSTLKLVNDFIIDSIEKKYVILEKKPQKINHFVYGSYDSITPIFASLEVTRLCPLKCLHCLNNSGKADENEMNTQEIKLVLNKLSQMGVQKLLITGGEPLARNDFEKILKYASENFFVILVNSNGYLVNDSLIKEIKKFGENIFFQISLDGNKETHNKLRGVDDSYDKAINAIRVLSLNKIPVIVASTINKDNFNQMESVTLDAKNNGAKQISFSSTLDYGRAKENSLANNIDISKIAENAHFLDKKYTDSNFIVAIEDNIDHTNEIKRKGCGAGVSQICIRPNGDIAPCVIMPYVFGNLLKQHVNKIFDADRIDIFNQLPRPNDKFCNNCSNKLVCRGCSSIALELCDEKCKWYENNKLILEKISNLCNCKSNEEKL